jgi:hypothetical protein
MLVATVCAQLPLSEPDCKTGLVTWFDLVVRDSIHDEIGAVGSARIAWIRVAEAMNRGVAVRSMLATAGLADLDELFFDATMNCLKAPFHNTLGWDVMFVAELGVTDIWRKKNIEEAIVLRMLETWAETCAIVVLPISERSDAVRWHRLAFQSAREPTADRPGYLYLDRSAKRPRLRDRDGDGRCFEIDEMI